MSTIVIPENSSLYTSFQEAVESCEIVFFAGLPGVGKSLFLQQLTLMAQQKGRKVHLLQWDVTRSAFETPDIIAKYPEIEGVTHAIIRKAVGLWTREAVFNWHISYAMSEHMLIGEVPLIGNRLMELVKPQIDATETILCGEETRFLLPVPSLEVRQVIESTRAKTIESPRHEKETKDAPPNIVQASWIELAQIAGKIGLGTQPANPPYSAGIYGGVYEYLLQHRHYKRLSVDLVLMPAGSVYDLDNIAGELCATPEQVKKIMDRLEQQPIQEIENDVENWYLV